MVAVARQVEAGRSVASFPEGALSPLAGGFCRPHSGVSRVALRTGVLVIPVGIRLRRDRIMVTRTQISREQATGLLYLHGPYAMTVGRPLICAGNSGDRERVRVMTEHIMGKFRALARESEKRVNPRANPARHLRREALCSLIRQPGFIPTFE